MGWRTTGRGWLRASCGDDFTVNPSPYALGEDFRSRWLPTPRQIIDLSDWDNSRFMHTTRQSGEPLERALRGFDPVAAAGDNAPMLWSREKVEQAAKPTVRLTP